MEHEKEYLSHYGVKGMKWGVRKKRSTSGAKKQTTGTKKATEGTKKITEKVKVLNAKRKETTEQKRAEKTKREQVSKRKALSDMTDDELNSFIKRLELEKRYTDLVRQQRPQKSRGRQTVENILYGASENVGKQIAVYAMGTAANKAIEQAFGIKDAVNPKKGQKD